MNESLLWVTLKTSMSVDACIYLAYSNKMGDSHVSPV